MNLTREGRYCIVGYNGNDTMIQWYNNFIFLFLGDAEGKDFAPPASDNIIGMLRYFMILIWADYCNEVYKERVH